MRGHNRNRKSDKEDCAMDFFSTDVLTTVITSLLGAPQFLKDRYFGTVQTEASEEIHFDVMDGKRRIAPFVSPLVEGQIVAHLAYKTYTFKPAYVKDKRVFDMNRPLKRSAGEQIGGSLSPMDRLRNLIAVELQDQRTMLNRRLEVMAGEILATGKATITGDKYPTVIVDFGRAAGNTVTASPLWSDSANSNPLKDLTTWSAIGLQSQGIVLTDAIFPPDAWSAFSTNPKVQDRLNLYRGIGAPPTLDLNAQLTEGAIYMGTIDAFNCWQYMSWYVDPADGVEKTILPSGKVILVSPLVEGVQAYGAIRDEEAGLQASPFFVKSWIEPDPSVRFIMLQSAPLLVPYRPNASVVATVL
jgi:hypothetical protein